MSKETFDFSEALRRMKEGKKVRRCGWVVPIPILLVKIGGEESMYILQKNLMKQ